MRYTTPLRYPGGKSRLTNFIKLVFRENNLLDGHYVEPYAGGASIAFSLLFYGYVSHIHINDLNKSVYAFWHSALYDIENLSRLICDTPVTMESWRQQKSIQENLSQHSVLEIGFSIFFLNRTNRSGIIQGGVIGGQKQNGKWKLDARYNKQDLIARIEKVERFRKQINLHNQDAAKFLFKIAPKLPANSLIYLDPPYYVKGHGLYENHYQHEDHVVVSKLVTRSVKQRWIVTYDNVPEIRRLYKGYRKLCYRLSYSAADRYEGSEVMFFSNKLIIPNVHSPTNKYCPSTC